MSCKKKVSCCPDPTTIIIYTFTYNFITYKICYNITTAELTLQYGTTIIKLSSSQCIDSDNPQTIPPIIPPTTPANSFNPRGTWDSIATYVINDLVRYQCGSYVCMVNNTVGYLPTNVTYWMLLVQDGMIKYFDQCPDEDDCSCSYEYEIFKNDSSINNQLNQFYNVILNGKGQIFWASVSTSYVMSNLQFNQTNLFDIKYNVVDNINTGLYSYYQPTYRLTFINIGLYKVTYCVPYSVSGTVGQNNQFVVDAYLFNGATQSIIPQSKKSQLALNNNTHYLEHTFLLKVPYVNMGLNVYYDKTGITYVGPITIYNAYVTVEYIGLSN
jgi:hypothetical protein